MDATPDPRGAVPLQPRVRRRRPVRAVVLALLFVVLVAALSGLGWLIMGYPDQRGPGRGRVVAIEIVRGAGVETVAEELSRAGALAQPPLFVAYATMRGAGAGLRSGRILLYDSMTPKQLLQRVATGFGSAELRVVIPEGFTRFDIADRLAQWGVCERGPFLEATEDTLLLRELVIDGPSAEGLLYPDTYLLHDAMDARAVVRRLVRNARRRFAPVLAEHQAQLAHLEAELGWGMHEIMTLASIVEKEARLAGERPIIAGVFLNRLRDPAFKPKRLQADPTVTYGCLVAPALASCAGAGRQITRAMLADAANPYNTYRRDGLPPGPIANPGVSSVRAVLAPVAHDYLYFVARGGGAHAFSRSLDEHQVAVEQLHAPMLNSPP
jgi:UPF0755 protein